MKVIVNPKEVIVDGEQDMVLTNKYHPIVVDKQPDDFPVSWTNTYILCCNKTNLKTKLILLGYCIRFIFKGKV